MVDLWRCPNCGREFARPRQWHSCFVASVEDHLEGLTSRTRDAFTALSDVLSDIEGVRVDAVKTGITLMTDRAFGYVAVRRHHLDLQLRFDDERGLDRARRVERVGTQSWAYEFRIERPDDVDAELVGLIREAAGFRL